MKAYKAFYNCKNGKLRKKTIDSPMQVSIVLNNPYIWFTKDGGVKGVWGFFSASTPDCYMKVAMLKFLNKYFIAKRAEIKNLLNYAYREMYDNGYETNYKRYMRYLRADLHNGDIDKKEYDKRREMFKNGEISFKKVN